MNITVDILYSLNFVSSQIQINKFLNNIGKRKTLGMFLYTNKFLKGLFYRSKLFLNEDLT